jgi:hypothetical protein
VRRNFFTAGFVTALLVLGAIMHHRLQSIEGTGSDAAVAVLLSVLTLITAYLASPGEHLLTSRTLFGLRVLGVASSLLSFTAAVFVVARARGAVLTLSWGILAGLGGVIVICTGISFRAARR